MDELKYKLKNPIKFQHKGSNNVEGTFILMKAPGFNTRHQAFTIKQFLMKAIKSLQTDTKLNPDASDSSSEANNDKITGEDIVNLFYTSDVDFREAMSAFEKLMVCGVCLINGEESFSIPLLEKLSLEDLESSFGEYVAYFLAPSS